MRPQQLPLLLLLALSPFAVALGAGGCKEEAKKDSTNAPRAPEPIPSDFVVNGFFPGGSDPTPKVEIRSDGGPVALPLDGAAAPAASGADPGATPSAGNANLKVLEPGEEPRVARKYELKAGKTENVTVTLRMSQEMSGQPAQSQPPMVFTLAMTPQAKVDGSFPIKVTIARAEIVPGPDVDPAQAKQMAQAFKMLSGQAAGFTLSAHGAVSGFALANEQLARSELGALAQQTLDGLFVVLPDDAIGKGARWEEVGTQRQDGIAVTTTTSYVLKDVTPDGLAITVTTKRKAPPSPMADPRAPKGTTIAIDGTTTANIKVRLERMPGKGSLDSSTIVNVNQAAGGGAPARTMQQKVSVKQTIDNSAG